jgi:hypothetical protein
MMCGVWHSYNCDATMWPAAGAFAHGPGFGSDASIQNARAATEHLVVVAFEHAVRNDVTGFDRPASRAAALNIGPFQHDRGVGGAMTMARQHADIEALLGRRAIDHGEQSGIG